MPANLTQQYLKARERYQSATESKEKLDALQEMLREIPKHKGTEHLQADIKRKIKETRAELQSTRKRKKGGPSYQVDSGGKPQVVVIGPPNSGKSALIDALTGLELVVAPYPFSTHEPHPAMMPFENARVQLVDMPPICAEHMESWIPSIVRAGDAVLLVIDLEAGDLLEATEAVVDRLASHKLFLGEIPEEHQDSIGAIGKRVVIAANKCDLPGAEDALSIFRELRPTAAEIVPCSAETRTGVEELRLAVWRMLDLVRAIPKPPGKPADFDDPILLPRGSTVLDMARAIHRDLPDQFKRARLWHDGRAGAWAARDHVLVDMEILELEH